MARIAYTLRLLSSGIIQIKVGRAVEHVTVRDIEKGQVFDAVKYALISKDAFVSDVRLTEDLHNEVWRHLR